MDGYPTTTARHRQGVPGWPVAVFTFDANATPLPLPVEKIGRHQSIIATEYNHFAPLGFWIRVLVGEIILPVGPVPAFLAQLEINSETLT